MEENKVILDLLYNKYGKVLLTTDETAHELNRSTLSLIRDRSSNKGLKFVKPSKTTQGRVYYSIADIAEHIIKCTTQ